MNNISSVSLFRNALQFFRVSKILVISKDSLPASAFGYIVSQSLELFLKAYLLSVGLTEKQIEVIGHNLEKAWSRAAKEGLQVSSDPPAWCSSLNSAYDRPFLLRYSRDNTSISVPSPRNTVMELESIMLTVAEALGLDREGNFA